MTTIEEARTAVEQDIREAYAEMPNERKADGWLAVSMEVADAYALAAHVDGCAFEEFDSSGEWRECGQEGWLCDIGKRIEEAR